MAGKSRADWNRRSVPLIIRFVSNVLWNWIHKHGRNSPISGVMPTFLNKIIEGESLLRLNSFADYRADAPRNSGCIWILGSHSCSKWDIEFDHQYFFLPFHGQLSFSLIHFICRNKVVVDNNYIYLVIKNYQIYMTLSIQYIYIYIFSLVLDRILCLFRSYWNSHAHSHAFSFFVPKLSVTFVLEARRLPSIPVESPPSTIFFVPSWNLVDDASPRNRIRNISTILAFFFNSCQAYVFCVAWLIFMCCTCQV